MAGKKKSPKASSKKPEKTTEVAAATPKGEMVNTESVVAEKVDNTNKAKQTKEVAKASSPKAKSGKADKADKDKGGKKSKAVRNFFKELKSEIKKISWNSKEDTIKSTGVVLLVVILVGIGIWIVDFGLTSLREFLYELSKSNAGEARIMLSMMLSGLM